MREVKHKQRVPLLFVKNTSNPFNNFFRHVLGFVHTRYSKPKTIWIRSTGAVFTKLFRKIIDLSENFKGTFPIYFQLYFIETCHAYEKHEQFH